MSILILTLLFATSIHCVEDSHTPKKTKYMRSPAMRHLWIQTPVEPEDPQSPQIAVHEDEPITPPLRSKRRKKLAAATRLEAIPERVHVPRKRKTYPPRVTPSPSPVDEVLPMNILEGYDGETSSDEERFGSSLMVSRMNSDLSKSNYLLWSHYYISDACRRKWAAEKDME